MHGIDVIDWLHQQPMREAVLMLSRDELMQRTVAAWSSIVFYFEAPDPLELEPHDVPDATSLLWRDVTLDDETLCILFGNEHLASLAIRRAGLLGLAFPDGTVHAIAKGYIEALVAVELAKVKRKS